MNFKCYRYNVPRCINMLIDIKKRIRYDFDSNKKKTLLYISAQLFKTEFSTITLKVKNKKKF